MLNVIMIKELFNERDEFENQIFAYKNNLTYDFNVNSPDVRVSDSKGNEICIYHDGNGINTRNWADKISKKLSKAVEEIKVNFNSYYQH